MPDIFHYDSRNPIYDKPPFESKLISRELDVPTHIYFVDDTEIETRVDYYLFDDGDGMSFDYRLHIDLSIWPEPSALEEDLRDTFYNATGIWAEPNRSLNKLNILKL